MKIAISAQGKDLQSELDARFGRCTNFIIIDTENDAFEILENPGVSAGGGAGIQAAQVVADREVETVLTGNVGPNAFDVLSASGIAVYTNLSGIIADVVAQFKSGSLKPQAQPTVTSHHGMNQPKTVTNLKRIAVPSESDKGMDALISAHFGRCPFFTLIDLDNDKIINVSAVPNPYFGNHQPGQVPQFVSSQEANVLLSGGMGQRAVTFFNEFGIEVASGASGTVAEGLKTYLQGNLPGYQPCSHDGRH